MISLMGGPSLFLSHSHRDRDFTNRLAKDLSARGVRVWLDQAAMFVGDSLLEKIRGAINEVDHFAVVLSQRSVSSDWVRQEVAVALERGVDGAPVPVLPILLDDCDLPAFARDRVVADFRVPERYQQAMDMLVRRLGLPDHPSPLMKAQGMQWPLPETAFEPTRIVKMRVAFYDGERYTLASPAMDGTLVTPDSAFIAEISWATLGTYMGVGIRQPSDLRVLHHEARAWLEPKKKLRDVGVESGDHIVCVFGKGLSATLDQLVDGFSRALALLESSGQRGGGEAQPSVERRLLDEAGDLIDVGRIDDARRVLDKVRGMPEGQPLAWYFTGRCCQEEGDMKQALACFRHALELKPSYPAALVEVGYCLNDLGRPADAIPNFIRALELDPDFHLAIVNAGVSHEQLGDLDRALACYEAALDRDPLNPHARQNKGSVLLRMGRVAEAAECFRDVLRLSASKQFQALAREGLARCSR